jgi:hypothetical protein
LGQVVDRRRDVSEPEVNQSGAQPACVSFVRRDEDVQVLGESRLGVNPDRVAPDQKESGSRGDQRT